ncbi:twin-arginine translocation signal domain-containing protein [Lacibacter luteus]|uniref:Twin-arginine translocation signal domain-containing protein n=1 Tax=Lacibacter luteus TaxID=2508719 RepID=A0A4Q1CJY9_9BACT|nr:twin-arginine translocation signal domain-containing protein [Lacibacter luteus]RXK60946.1 twin-arginine translocation signal domain-containing protein [Lacibacter luteus]
MNVSNNSRRSFLTNAAILTAGLAIASPVQLFAKPVSSTNLNESWKTFCKMYNAVRLQQTGDLKDEAVNRIAKGHVAVEGEYVHFQQEQLVARPIWIYWGEKKSTPDDVIVTFFSTKSAPEKLFRLNRYELEGLLQLAKQNNQVNLVLLLKEDTINRLKKNNKQSQLIVKAKVNNNKRVTVESSFA